ncbi:uncharacterized protein Dwil_GK11120 [Drosophila willistoni]|uniref:Chloride channel CLIC-like protein 1 n=1 Tax=Drosophila willistoni TaxID=7260 RepID=B4N811_DROWI|nr:uncharacterized protein LOC6647054 [Drosophila willistoni]EDW81262.2 uncharacterized protein Dwil_GK11120 [Drosophila willistoni]
MRVNFLLSFLLFLTPTVWCQSGQNDGESWIDPHVAWSDWALTDSNADTCQCQATPESIAAIEDAVALTYFKKFVKLLFQRQRLQFDATSTLYKRSLLFSLFPDQLEQLEAVEDARDLDIILMRILENAEAAPLFPGGNGCSYTYFSWLPDIFTDFIQLTKHSEVRLLLKLLIIGVVAWLTNKRYGVGALTLTICGIFFYGYFITYLECNKKLEVDAMIDMIDNSQKLDSSSLSWGSRAWNYFFQESEIDQQKARLRKSAKLNMSECRLDYVLIMYLNDLFLKQLEMLLEKVTQTMSKLSSEMPFPFNLIAPFALVALVGYIVKLTFKYVISPKVWIKMRHSSPPAPAPHQLQPQHNEALGDRLSGENLKMLLNAINVTSTQQSSQLPAVSGVQDILDGPSPLAIENKAKASNEKLNSSKDSDTSVKNSAQDAGFTLIDDPDNDHSDDNIDNL